MKKWTVAAFQAAKGKRKLGCCTAYDACFAHLADAAGIPCCKVLSTREMMSLPQLVSRGMIAGLPAPNSLQAAGIPTLTARGPHIRYAKTPAVERQPPDLGQHNGELLERYGLSAEDAALLEREWKQKTVVKR